MTGRLSTVLLVALLLVGAVGGTAAGDTDGVEPDRVVMDVAVGADGDARWRVAYRFRLGTENATTAFEAFRASVEENTSAYRERFAARMNRTVRAAENATGREMAVRNVSVRTSRDELTEYGVVTYRFRWTGFAAVSGDRLIAGDALEALYIDRRTTLVVSWPDRYRASAVEPGADRRHDESVAWVGPTRFDSGEPRVVLEPATAPGTAGETGTPSTSLADDEDPDSGGSLPVGGAAFGGAVLAVGLGATLALAARRDGSGTTGAAETGAAGPAAGDEPLETPDERVLSLLREEGGRMKQARVAERLDWSSAKTSRVVGDLREAGEVETFRVGRENVVALPEN